MKLSMQVPATAKPGDTVEIDVPGVFPEAEVVPKAAVERIVTDRLAQFAQGRVRVDELDAAAIKTLAEKKGLKLAGEGEGDLGKQLEGAKRTWAETELKPVMDREQSLRSELEGARKERLYDAIITAAAKSGVLPGLLEGSGGSKAAIVAMHEHRFAFDEKSRGWYLKGASAEQPFAFATQPSAERPYKTPDEAISEWAKLPTSKPFIGLVTQQGPNLQTGGRTGMPGVVERDPVSIGRNLEAIASGKAVVQ